MSQSLDAYRILQVLPDADQDEIKDAFRRLARRYHPDRAPDAESTARMIEVNRAWELVGDPVRRAAYDRANGYLPRAIRAGAARPAATGTGPPGAPHDPVSPTHATRPGAAGRHRPAGSSGTAGPAATGPDGGGAGPRSTVGGTGAATAANGSTGPDGPGGTSTSPGGSGPLDTASGAEVGGYGPAGPPPGRPVGRVLTFGRYSGWSLGEIARVDREYLEWFVRMPVAWQYRDEIRELLASHARTQAEVRSAAASADRPLTRRRGILGR